MKNVFATLALVSLSFVTPAVAQERLTVAVGEYLPFAGRSADGGALGVIGEPVAIIAQSMGLDLEVQVMPFSRVYNSVHNGNVDMAIGVLGTPERKELALYGDPVITEYSVLAIAADSDLDIRSVSDLAGARIGGIRGFSYPSLAAAGLEVEPAANHDSNIQKLLAGRIDVAVVSSIGYIAAFNRTEDAGKIRVVPFALGAVPLGIALADETQDDARLQEFNNRLQAFLQTQEFADILNKYEVAEYVVDMPILEQ